VNQIKFSAKYARVPKRNIITITALFQGKKAVIV